MSNIRIKIIILLLVLWTLKIDAGNYHFPIITAKQAATIIIDKDDSKVVSIAANILSEDVQKVSSHKLVIGKKSKYTIIAGTIGNSKPVDRLIAANKLQVSAVKNKWEAYSIQVIDHPDKDIQRALVIIGSDRRGTAFGLLEISRMIGVSPWEWWADVIPEQKDEIILNVENRIYGSPSVKYRGIFLNDEDWGLQRWAALNFEPEVGDIGPKTYAKVFELLLRLRANTIWPAMHSCTKPFYYYPENKQVADDYAIVVGTSHCEPMLCNINAEWDNKTMGEWRYDNNSTTIKELFNRRIRETANYESIYTMGMRGEHDSPMIVGDDDTDTQVKLLNQVINDQRNIIKDRTGKKEDQIPQIFIPYKEVLTYYQAGLELPDDISLVWTDDNYGYIRQLSNPEEQKRSGGAGVYYHTSYWGRPHDYLWLNSTNPVLMWEEMSKAYQLNAKNVWVLNCGDIKPHEYSIELFLDMAWDINKFNKSQDVKKHLTSWAAREFGVNNACDISDLIFEYYRLSFIRRPEFMAWSQVEPVTKAGETELSQIHYGDEVSKRIQEYEKLLNEVEKLNKKIPTHRKDAFYELVHYPVKAAALLNFKWLYAYKNIFTAQQGRESAAYFGEQSLDAYQQIKTETDYFNHHLKNGKWNHIMNMAPRNLPVFSEPVICSSVQNSKPEFGLALEGYEMEVNHHIINSFADVLPVFNAYTRDEYFIDVFLKGLGEINWQAFSKDRWIILSDDKGVIDDVNQEQRIKVSIDWDQVPKGENLKEAPLGHDYQLIPPGYKVNSSIEFKTEDTTIIIGVSVFNPKLEELKNFKGFVEDKGFISINAENYTLTTIGSQAKWDVYEGIGYSGNVVVTTPITARPQTDIESILKNSPVLEYDFYSFNFGDAKIYIRGIPTHPVYSNRGVRCAISIDDSQPVFVDFETKGRSEEWKQNVLRNATVKSAKQIVNKAGKHTLKVWMVDPGVMIDQILIDFGGWKDSYAFPKESKL